MFNIARQSGKSTVAAAKAVWRAILFPKSLVVIVCPAIQQAQELRRKIDAHIDNMKGEKPTEKEANKRTLEFANGSRIVIAAADSDTIRSYSAVDLLIEDETQLIPDAVYEATEPMLGVSKGQHMLMGTPNGLKGHFAVFWHMKDQEAAPELRWHRFQVTCWDDIRRDGAYFRALKAEKESLGRGWWFEQEYECSFIAAAQGLVYPYTAAKNSSPRLDLHERYGWQFVLGADYGYVDSTAYVVLGWRRDDPTVYVVETFEQRGLLASEAAEIAKRLMKKYPFARMVGDIGGFGKGYVEEARRHFQIPMQAAEKNNKRGFIELMVSDLKSGILKVMPGNDGLLEEWARLPWDEEREMPADGYKDHLADAGLYAWRACCHFLEEVRKEKPKKGTPEAYQAEADLMLETRIRQVQKKDQEWWEEGDASWLQQSEAPAWTN